MRSALEEITNVPCKRVNTDFTSNFKKVQNFNENQLINDDNYETNKRRKKIWKTETDFALLNYTVNRTLFGNSFEFPNGALNTSPIALTSSIASSPLNVLPTTDEQSFYDPPLALACSSNWTWSFGNNDTRDSCIAVGTDDGNLNLYACINNNNHNKNSNNRLRSRNIGNYSRLYTPPDSSDIEDEYDSDINMDTDNTSVENGIPNDKESNLTQMLSYRIHSSAIFDVAFSPSQEGIIATASGDGTIALFSLEKESTISNINGVVDSFWSPADIDPTKVYNKSRVLYAPSPSYSSLCAADINISKTTTRRRRAGGKSKVPRPGYLAGNVKNVRFHPKESNILASSSRNGRIDIYDLRDKNNNKTSCISILCAHDMFMGTDCGRSCRSVTALEWGMESDNRLFSGSDANEGLLVWDIRWPKNSGDNNKNSYCGSLVDAVSSKTPKTRYGISSIVVDRSNNSSSGGSIYSLSMDGRIKEYSLACPFNEPLRSTSIGTIPMESFYVKMSIPHDGSDYNLNGDNSINNYGTKYIATGSSTGNPLLIPTPLSDNNENNIIELFNGHDNKFCNGNRKEATVTSWTYSGNLVTVADDCSVRLWKAGLNNNLPTNENVRIGHNWGWARTNY